MHLVVDALGLPIDFEVTEGQRHESVVAVRLVERVRPRCLLADKGFDANAFRDALERTGCVAVIPCQGNRVRPMPYDKELYKARRFATRYEKTLRNYASVVALGCALLWLRI